MCIYIPWQIQFAFERTNENREACATGAESCVIGGGQIKPGISHIHLSHDQVLDDKDPFDRHCLLLRDAE